MARMSYGVAFLIALDQLLNAALAGFPDETLSARAYRCGVLDKTPKKRWRFMHTLINCLFFWQPFHCAQAYQSEQERKHSPSMPAGNSLSA